MNAIIGMNAPKRTLKKLAILIALAAAAIASTFVTSPPAAAASRNWNAVAMCESTGNWHANTGNGFYGGLQFTHSTWKAFGGSTANAHLASKAEQIAVAEKVLKVQGPGAWPNCGVHL